MKQAHVIVFLGYRFPPSDSHARTELLGGIGENEVQQLRIHTVLGPDTNHENSVRLTKLLEHTLSRKRPERHNGLMARVINQPMYVEDFLSVLHEGILYEQWPG